MINRVILIVLDSVGIGELPDAELYGDKGSDTLDNISKKIGNLKLPNLSKLGLGNIEGVDQIEKSSCLQGAYGRCKEVSPGKDTTTGHWEIAGLHLKKAFPTYPEGFPKDIVDEFEGLTETKILGNKPASGTVIIQELGDEHVKTGYPILYTSADSVFQLAAHEEVIPLDKLYSMCITARNMLKGEHAVGRVIARPFVGSSGSYKRTANRKDFSLKPAKPTILNYISEAGMDVCAVGKIEDIFSESGITKSVHTKCNMEGIDKTIEYIKEDTTGLIFTNLVDFDMLYGHRNDVEGYGRALEEFDQRLPEILSVMKKEDVLIITADHGCDPTTPSTDHSREYIPVMIYGEQIKPGVCIGTRDSFSDIGKTITSLLNVTADTAGNSFAEEILK